MSRLSITRIRRTSAVALLSLGAVLVLAGSGCTSVKSNGADTSKSPASSVAVSRMAPEEVRARIATSFPAELPVAQGEVLSGRAQGDDAWDYQLTVTAPVRVVALWYSDQYERRGWELSEGNISGDVVSLTLRKGAGESRITLKPSGDAGSTTVTGIASVGVPVLETQ